MASIWEAIVLFDSRRLAETNTPASASGSTTPTFSARMSAALLRSRLVA